MKDIFASLAGLRSIETLSLGRSVLHKIDARAKILFTLAYILAVMSRDRYDLRGLVPFFIYPAFAFCVLPARVIIKRLTLVLPFCIFAGCASLIFERNIAFYAYGIPITYGALIFASLTGRTMLCFSAALILTATTPFRDILAALKFFRVPALFVAVFEMTYRYIQIIGEEAASMKRAYLRGGDVTIWDMGNFAGSLALRSFDRAEKVFTAMKCRGWDL